MDENPIDVSEVNKFLFEVNAFLLQPDKIEDKFVGLLEKKWTSVIRLQKKVRV